MTSVSIRRLPGDGEHMLRVVWKMPQSKKGKTKKGNRTCDQSVCVQHILSPAVGWMSERVTDLFIFVCCVVVRDEYSPRRGRLSGGKSKRERVSRETFCFWPGKCHWTEVAASQIMSITRDFLVAKTIAFLNNFFASRKEEWFSPTISIDWHSA